MAKDLSTPRQHASRALLIAAGIFAATAVFDLIAHPASQGALHTYKEYVLTATIFPAVAAVMWALLALQGLHHDRNGRLGRTGLLVATAGLIALVIDSIVTIASASTETTGPLYPIAMIASVIGIVLLAIHWDRARILPRWMGSTLALGWFLGATPILGSGGFLIVGAAFIAVAVGLRRRTAIPVAAAVGMETSVTA